MKLGIKIVLWILIIFLGYKLYNSIIGPVHFNQTKEKRYVAVIEKLKDIKAGQLAYQELNGSFASNFDTLVQFLDTAKFAITARRDTSYADVARNRAFGLDPQKGGYYIEDVIIDTLSFASIKDSIYPGSDRYKTMMNIPDSEEQFELRAGAIDKNGTVYQVFEAITLSYNGLKQGEIFGNRKRNVFVASCFVISLGTQAHIVAHCRYWNAPTAPHLDEP